MNIFARWQIKLLALVMAISLYFFTSTQITIERTITVQVNENTLSGLDNKYILSRLTPREFDITIAGPQSVAQEVSPQDVEPSLTIGTGGLAAGFQEFDITERLLRLDPSLTLRGSSVDRIRAEFSRVVEDVLSLDGRPAITGLPEGLRADVSLVRSHVKVSGPANVIAKLQQSGHLRVRPIDLSQVSPTLSEPLELRVPLILEIADSNIQTMEQPEAVVRIAATPETQVVGPVPVNMLAAPDFFTRYQVEVIPALIAVTISGPANRMREGDHIGQVRAYVDLLDVRRSNFSEERIVRILTPSWMQATTTQVRVTVRPRGDDTIGPLLPGPREQPRPPPPEPENSKP